MPDKRQESKQRRAARNRANREALAARRENALTEASSPPSRSAASSSSSSSSSSRSSSSPPATAGGGAATPAPPPSGLLGLLRSKRPGDKAVLVAALLAILAALGMLFLFKVSVDDRGEPIPTPDYGGLTVAAREAVTGETVPDRSETLLDAYGAGVALYALIPVAVVGFALWGVRRPDRSRMLTFAMLAMAGVVVLGSLVYFFPALIALLVAGFQVRRADLPARAAQPFGGRGRRGGDVIDTTATEGGAEAAGDEEADADTVDADTVDADTVDADTVDADLAGDEIDEGEGEGEGAAGAEAGAATEAPPDDAEPDPLAELEAEIEAERAAEGGEPRPDDGGGPGTTGR